MMVSNSLLNKKHLRKSLNILDLWRLIMIIKH